MDVVISGASGLIGSALARSLEADGHRVLRLARPSSNSETSPNVIQWDPMVGTIDAAGIDGVDVVVQSRGCGDR